MDGPSRAGRNDLQFTLPTPAWAEGDPPFFALMIDQSTSGETLKRTRENAYAGWWTPAQSPNTVAARYLAKEFFPVQFTPGFKLSAESKVFTIGSCFAREIEEVLIQKGVTVLTGHFMVPMSCYKSIPPALAHLPCHPGILNKYNPHSMLMEIQRAISDYPIKDEGLIEVSPGVWFDPQSTNIKAGDYATVLDLRKQVLGVTARIKDADVVFITLGMTETWYDSQTGLSLNTTPDPLYLRSMPDRFYFKNATYEEVATCLRSIFTLLRQYGKPGVKSVLTVSPVPFGKTFSGQDVVQAHAYSKATLLSAARQIVSEFEEVDYFPSYEMVTFSPVELAFKEDFAHVREAMVGFVMEKFLQGYLAAPPV